MSCKPVFKRRHRGILIHRFDSVCKEHATNSSIPASCLLRHPSLHASPCLSRMSSSCFRAYKVNYVIGVQVSRQNDRLLLLLLRTMRMPISKAKGPSQLAILFACASVIISMLWDSAARHWLACRSWYPIALVSPCHFPFVTARVCTHHLGNEHAADIDSLLHALLVLPKARVNVSHDPLPSNQIVAHISAGELLPRMDVSRASSSREARVIFSDISMPGAAALSATSCPRWS